MGRYLPEFRPPGFLVCEVVEDHSGIGACFWGPLALFIEIVLWLIFLIMLVVIFPFYIIIAPIVAAYKRECKCPDFIVNYFRICFFASAVCLAALGSSNYKR